MNRLKFCKELLKQNCFKRKILCKSFKVNIRSGCNSKQHAIFWSGIATRTKELFGRPLKLTFLFIPGLRDNLVWPKEHKMLQMLRPFHRYQEKWISLFKLKGCKGLQKHFLIKMWYTQLFSRVKTLSKITNLSFAS